MNFKRLIKYSFLILIPCLVQILLLKNIALFGVAFCFIYLLTILSLPTTIPQIPLLLTSFGIGLLIDIFYDTLGMHALAATFLAFLRPFWLKIISPIGGYEDTTDPSISEMGIRWFLTYSLPLVFAFCLVFFLVNQWGTGEVVNILNKSFFSTIFTVILAIIVQLLFFKRSRGI
jgi:hypothetical protein